MRDSIDFESGFAEVNGINMYYECYGRGKPLVLIHGGGSTIATSFGRIIPKLAQNNRVIGVELQNHGRSGFRSVLQTFEQDAGDVITLLNKIGIDRASFLGFSNGGTTAMLLANRYPEIVNKLVLASAAYKREGFVPGFFEGMQQATLSNMPRELKAAFLQINPDPAGLQTMFEKDRNRMITFKGLKDDQLKSITAPTLIINGDADVLRPEHAVEMHRLIQNSQLAIIPGGHGEYIGEITTLKNNEGSTDLVVSMMQKFLDEPN